MRYSDKFKARVVARMAGPSGVPPSVLAEEVGVAKSTLWRWANARLPAAMEADDDDDVVTPSRPDLDALDRARLVTEAARFRGEALGAWLRTNGIHQEELEEWRRALVAALDPKAAKRQEKADAKRIKKLERELRNKEKALAEAAAILVLRKKAQALWGDEDDDTSSTNEPES